MLIWLSNGLTRLDRSLFVRLLSIAALLEHAKDDNALEVATGLAIAVILIETVAYEVLRVRLVAREAPEDKVESLRQRGDPVSTRHFSRHF
jgi:hypothetical protein